jgi:hypothetical protein
VDVQSEELESTQDKAEVCTKESQKGHFLGALGNTTLQWHSTIAALLWQDVEQAFDD